MKYQTIKRIRSQGKSTHSDKEYAFVTIPVRRASKLVREQES